MKYFVIATVWDDVRRSWVQEIAGSFEHYYLAHLFADAYNQKYEGNAKVISCTKLANAYEL